MGSLATAEKARTVAEGYRTRRLNWLIWFIWLVSLNQKNQTNQIDQINQLGPHKHDRGKQDSQCQEERAASDPGRP